MQIRESFTTYCKYTNISCSATDCGYASKANAGYAEKKGIKNIVFNKIAGSLKNIVSSKNIETRLKKWRSGVEAVIFNFKRGYNMFRCKC